MDRRADVPASSTVSTSEGTAVQQKHSFFAFVECSAKLLNNYKTPFDKSILAVLKHREKSSQKIKAKKKFCAVF